ncbi:unnamed protein product [Trifolium pratense]|uniref:Uncharacterized protein n=1 Tax=Trifolium pratense TaxID=57577 RepID=A0ACB0IRU1_TRIPR|nr:unnamed protein product [Trifolium pratense]
MANNILPKSLQEMSMDGDEPPSQYLDKGNSFGSKETSTLTPIPIRVLYMKVKSMIDYLLRNMSRSLNLEEGSFLDQFGKKSLLKARINFYPSCSRPDLVLGVKPHTDRPEITVVLQDKEVEGLQ